RRTWILPKCSNWRIALQRLLGLCARRSRSTSKRATTSPPRVPARASRSSADSRSEPPPAGGVDLIPRRPAGFEGAERLQHGARVSPVPLRRERERLGGPAPRGGAGR